MSTRQPLKSLRVLLPALLLAISVGGPLRAEEKGAASTVRIDNFTFSSAEMTIAPGTTITWINGDDIPHTVVATNKAFRSKVMDTEQQFSFTFKDAGTYEYFCSLHPHMTGKVIVK
jgi:amicyanin